MDFYQEFEKLKQAHADLHFEAINRGLIMMKAKSMLMKKRGLSNDIEMVVTWCAEQEQKLNTEFLIKCREAGITEDEFTQIAHWFKSDENLSIILTL